MEINNYEEIISDFLRTSYSDEQLAALLAHAEDGKLAFDSCCCLIGIPTADHALQGRTSAFENYLDGHYHLAKYGVADADKTKHMEPLLGIALVENAFLKLAPLHTDDDIRNAKLIPLIRAEIERRERERTESSSKSLQRAVLSV